MPALLRAVFGVIQFAAAATTFAFSLFFCTSSEGRDVIFHSLRHIFHGLVNILTGILQAIPIVGTVMGGIQASKATEYSSVNGGIYTNDQRHKFFGYSTIRSNTWGFYEPTKDTRPLNRDEQITGQPTWDATFAV